VHDRSMHAVVHALNIHTENLVKVLFRGALQVADMRDSGVVHQDVDGPFLGDLVEYRFHVVLAGHVAVVGFRVSPGSDDFVDDSLGGSLVDVQHADAGATVGKSLRNRTPDAARSPRDYGKFAVEAKSV